MCVYFCLCVLFPRPSIHPPKQPTPLTPNPTIHLTQPFLEHIIAGASLSSTDVEAAFDRILAGADPVQVTRACGGRLTDLTGMAVVECLDVRPSVFIHLHPNNERKQQVGALLAMLRQRGETPVEIAGMVRAMLKQRFPVNVTGKLLDIVGTGGDGAHTINISTAAIVLAAACGAKAAKLGNRSVSSKCGSADVLEALGIDVELSAEQVAECIEATGVGFMFAPVVHPAMKVRVPWHAAVVSFVCVYILVWYILWRGVWAVARWSVWGRQTGPGPPTIAPPPPRRPSSPQIPPTPPLQQQSPPHPNPTDPTIQSNPTPHFKTNKKTKQNNDRKWPLSARRWACARPSTSSARSSTRRGRST